MGGTFQSKTYQVEKENRKSGNDFRPKLVEKREFGIQKDKNLNETPIKNRPIDDDTSGGNSNNDKAKLATGSLSGDQHVIQIDNKVQNGFASDSSVSSECKSENAKVEGFVAESKDEQPIADEVKEEPEDIKLPNTLQNLLMEVNAEVCIENNDSKSRQVPESELERHEEDCSKSINGNDQDENLPEGELEENIHTKLSKIEIISCNGPETDQGKKEAVENVTIEVSEDKVTSKEESTVNEEKTSAFAEPMTEKCSESDLMDKIEVISEPTPSNEANLNTTNLHTSIKGENYNEESSSICASNESCKTLNEATSCEIKENTSIDSEGTNATNKITTTSPVDCVINNENQDPGVSDDDNNTKELEIGQDPLLNNILVIEQEIRSFYETAEGKGESYTSTLRELLMRSMVKLDNLEVNNESTRIERKRVIKYAQSCLNSIQSKN